MLRRARDGVARARRRSRGAGDRATPATGARSRPASTSSQLEPRPRRAARAVAAGPSDFELRFTAWHNDVWKPVIAAVNGVCAGGGLHFVADADIVIAASRRARSSTRTCRSARSTAYEAIALMRKSPMEAVMRMAFVGRHERMTAAARATSSASSARSSTRPSGCATRPRSWPRRSPATRRRRWRRRSGRCGARSSWASPTRAGPAPRELVVDVGPPRPGRRARWRSPRSASRAWHRSTARRVGARR